MGVTAIIRHKFRRETLNLFGKPKKATTGKEYPVRLWIPESPAAGKGHPHPGEYIPQPPAEGAIAA